MSTETGGPAFPIHPGVAMDGQLVRETQGMTLRDWFAGLAMQGLLANPGGPIQANGMSGWNWCNCSPEDAVNLAYSIADAMLKAREES